MSAIYQYLSNLSLRLVLSVSILLLIISCVSQCSSAYKRNYSEHSIVRIPQQSLHLLEAVTAAAADISNEITSPAEDHSHDILWLDNAGTNHTFAYVSVHSKHVRKIRDAPGLRDAKLMSDDLQSWLDAAADLRTDSAISVGVNSFQSALVPSFQLDRYHPLSNVYHYLEVISKLTRVKVFDIGVSHEGRSIKAVEILNNPADTNIIFIDGCTHSREWITVATALYIIEHAITSGLKQNFIVIPVINVDGYEYTWNTDRLWRKNRRPYTTSHSPDRCTGVDLNRNYDINFLGEGSSSNPCSFLYGGPSAFSEPEVRAVSELLWSLRNQIKLTVSLHSFNQLWASPYAYTKEPPVHYNHHMSVLRDIQSAVYRTNGVKYQIGPLSTSLYVGSGFMMDWIYTKLGIVNAYLVELRDRGTHGFVLPVDQIIPTASETWSGLLAAIKKLFV